ncbi:exonuclease subunit SbcD [Oscillatoria sp. CS-180]|uniref:exonuclease subunit SbcD n=1 Tax=Oscillatoria sp. CS-180 TaxID=3021720 RepID=UPI00232D537E|nr:exonuclease subunit SbcD [Oscillatoria sp. CS-180]MDB9527808.1 exonuclease subunit SbcD [Oscillatoria sp. CS-180]
MISVLHLSDIHMGSGFSHGRINPETGMNTRLEDFVGTLSRCIDRAIAEPADLVLFGGDAFPDATPPPLVQQAFAGQFRRLADAGIPTVLLVGNHDQHAQGQGGASLSIYRTLGVPGVVVGDRLQTHHIETQNGAVQVVTLPWLTPSVLLTRPEIEGLSMAEVSQQLLDRLRVALEGEIRRLNPDIPTILLGHLMTDTASFGAEKFLAVGRGFTVPMAMLARPCFDYVALGHVHRHQVLCESPPVVYPGSIERVDFSEAEEAKGYVWAKIAKKSTEITFCSLPVRPFLTVTIDLTGSDSPQMDICRAIAQQPIQDAVVRLMYSVRPDQIDNLDNTALYDALSDAHTYTIHPQIVTQKSRSRLPELATGNTLAPIDALQTYLNNREDLTELADEMLAAAQALLADTPFEPDDVADVSPLDVVDDETSRQLRLL